ncbi:MAG: DUF559 domain-containing protein [Bacteroidota bacterium]
MDALNTDKKRKAKTINDVLVVLLPSVADFKILKEQNWYRIPVKTAPKTVKEKQIEYIAFYHTSKFDKQLKFTISYYAKVTSIEVVARKELFPDESSLHPKAKKMYYKISISKLIPASPPIYSKRPRRILFIPTTTEKFFNTIKLERPEINYLFNDSPLENILFQKLLEENIPCERQYMTTVERSKYVLDFAIFCREGKIDIECDGDTYHNEVHQIHYDKARNNELTVHDWSVLRFPTHKITKEIDEVIYQIKKTINNYGGYLVAEDAPPIYTQMGKQGRLFS